MPPTYGAFWTIVPNGYAQQEGGSEQQSVRLRASVTVAFQLNGGLTLDAYPALRDWPHTLGLASFVVKAVPTSGGPAGGYSVTPTVVSAPSSAAWRAVFPTTTSVLQQRPEDYESFDQKAIRTYPRANVADFVRQIYLGTLDAPGAPPTGATAELVRSALLRSGGDLHLYTDMQTTQDNTLTKSPGQPGTWVLQQRDLTVQRNPAIRPEDLDHAVLYDFTQVRDYYKPIRLPNGQVPEKLAAPTLPATFDFQQIAGLTMLQPAVARALGLVFDIEFNLPFGFEPGLLSIVPTYDAPGVTRTDTSYPTKYISDIGYFEVDSEANDEQRLRYLRLGVGDYFQVEDGLDVEGASLKAMAKADDPGALRTVGLGVSHINAAAALAQRRQQDRIRFNKSYGLTLQSKAAAGDFANKAPLATPDFVHESADVTRGYRFDVFDETADRWYSLHKRAGHYVLGDPSSHPVRVPSDAALDEEGFTMPVATRRKPTAKDQPEPSDDFALSETLMRWQGWSLSVPRIGGPIENDDRVHNETPPTTDHFGRVQSLMSQAKELPRLRFGRWYRFRARVVDAAGNSVDFDPAMDPNDPAFSDIVSPRVRFRRFDPIESPTLLYQAPPTVGEHVHELVVRTETPAAFESGMTSRLVPPPATSEWLAENHGAFDAGDGFRSDAYTLLNDREGKSWADHQPHGTVASGGPVTEIYIEENSPPLPYLPDVLARRICFMDLPETVGQTRSLVVSQLPDRAWPDYRVARLVLNKSHDVVGPGEFSGPGVHDSAGTNTVHVSLGIGDVRTIQIASALTPYGNDGRPDEQREGDADLFGPFAWLLDHLADQEGPTIDPDVLRGFVADGLAPGATPRQAVKLVHAVRTPLMVPSYAVSGNAFNFSVVDRAPKDTIAWITTAVNYSMRSTGRIEISGAWSDNIDKGPGTAAPSSIQRTIPVLRAELDRDAVPPGLPSDLGVHDVSQYDTAHDFGDTKHHYVGYTPRATTAFLKYFRDTNTLSWTGPEAPRPFTQGAVSPAPITVVGVTSKRNYVEGTDYTIDHAHGTISRTVVGSTPRINEPVEISFVKGVIDQTGAPFFAHVNATTRPKPPAVHSIVPTFVWDFTPGLRVLPNEVGTSTRRGGGLRVWLDRPWFSSGNEERLAVIVSTGASPTPEALPYVTRFGNDPVFDTKTVVQYPSAERFAGNDLAPRVVGLTENDRSVVAVAYPVHFDPESDRWYADIQVATSKDDLTVGYFPFVRLVLARFQPFSAKSGRRRLPGSDGDVSLEQDTLLALSTTVVTDYVQVAPDRTARVTRRTGGSSPTYAVEVTGESYVKMHREDTDNPVPAGRTVSDIIVTLQERDTSIADETLGWRDVTSGLGMQRGVRQTQLTAVKQGGASSTLYKWTGTITIPSAALLGRGASTKYRLLIEEYETHYTDQDGVGAQQLVPDPTGHVRITVTNTVVRHPTGRRCTYQDMIELP